LPARRKPRAVFRDTFPLNSNHWKKSKPKISSDWKNIALSASPQLDAKLVRPTFATVFGSISKVLIALALVFSIGLHWNLLQVAAWTGMIVKYSQDGSIKSAVEKTFDGEHPCCLCKAVAKGKASERNPTQEQTKTKKPEMFCSSESPTFPPTYHRLPVVMTADGSIQFTQIPPVPPPRV
jgi:hypothetical protein